MPQLVYDVVVLGDLRLPGPTGRAIAEELRAQARAGYRTALLHVNGPLLKRPHPINPTIEQAIRGGLADWLDPEVACAARLAVAHHPATFEHLPARAPRLTAEHKVLVINHPLFDARGRRFVDLRTIVWGLTDLLGDGLRLAPAGPQLRAQLEAASFQTLLLERDWPPVLDPLTFDPGNTEVAGARPERGSLVVGREAPADRLDWPTTSADLFAAYPDDPEIRVWIRGDRRSLRDLPTQWPAHWKLVDPRAVSAAAFVAQLDACVHVGARDVVQPVRFPVLEALAGGTPVVLPDQCRATFQDAALYAGADGTRDAFQRLLNAPVRAELVARGRGLIADKFSHEAHRQRVSALIGPPAPTRVLGLRRERRPRRRVLFLSSNGIGMGHLTRLLAIARRCSSAIQPVFLAMSQAAEVVERFGYLVEFTAHHLYLDLDVEDWNAALRAQLNEAIAFYDARAVLFDGNVPYRGLIDARLDHPEVPFVWCRRGMWRPSAGRVALERARHFDAVIAPRDLAERYDRGETAFHDEPCRLVEPILLLDRHELLAREAARAELGLHPDRPAVLIQLGSRNNYDYGELFDIACHHLRQHHDVQIAIAEWLISETASELPADVVRLRSYPLCRHFRAFDAAISAVGYNSFHELILHALPTIFVPNEHPSMDDQLMRALFAERHGLGVCLRTEARYQVRRAIDRILDPDERAVIAGRCRSLTLANGAEEAARLIEELVLGLPASRPQPWAERLVRRQPLTI